jgi:hypothetical protein
MILGGRLCDCNPDYERKDGGTLGGNGQIGKGDRDRGQSTGKGVNNHDDNRHIKSRLSFYFEYKYHAQMLRQRGKLHPKLQRVCW